MKHTCLALFCTKPFLILHSEDPTWQAGQRVSFPSCPRGNRGQRRGDSLRVTQLVSGGLGTGLWALWSTTGGQSELRKGPRPRPQGQPSRAHAQHPPRAPVWRGAVLRSLLASSSHTHCSQQRPGKLTRRGWWHQRRGGRTRRHSGVQPTAPSTHVQLNLQLGWKDWPLL